MKPGTLNSLPGYPGYLVSVDEGLLYGPRGRPLRPNKHGQFTVYQDGRKVYIHRSDIFPDTGKVFDVASYPGHTFRSDGTVRLPDGSVHSAGRGGYLPVVPPVRASTVRACLAPDSPDYPCPVNHLKPIPNHPGFFLDHRGRVWTNRRGDWRPLQPHRDTSAYLSGRWRFALVNTRGKQARLTIPAIRHLIATGSLPPKKKHIQSPNV